MPRRLKAHDVIRKIITPFFRWLWLIALILLALLAASVACQGFDLCLPPEDYHVDRTAALRHRPASQPSGSPVGHGGVPRAEPAVAPPPRAARGGGAAFRPRGRRGPPPPLRRKVFAVGVAHGSV